MTFVESYGPWAVVAGASEGVGASFALTELSKRLAPDEDDVEKDLA